MPKWRTWMTLVAAWLPLAAWYSLLLATYGSQPFPRAMLVGILAIGTAALLGLGVWWLTGRYQWPERFRASFYAAHLLLAIAFAVTWLLTDLALIVTILGSVVFHRALALMGWELLLGVWLYGLIAGVSYTVRTRRKLEEQQVAAVRADALAAQARLTALRAQLNPHFLFNALHSLSNLVRHDAAGAERALNQLGELLRYALADGATEDVALADEWSFTENYLALERVRFGNRLAVEAKVDPAALECELPSFTLQPLVENAVHHGIAPRPEGGRLRITARRDGGFLELTVGDDGVGASRAALESAEGLGLRALRQRIEARYAGKAEVRIVTEVDRGFTAAVRIPCDRGANGEEEGR